ncbi:AraC family transcriptional regulator [Phenylobacterium sp. LjRoot225]|uniref:AraC family transcriptional regulator n=1 Tax=Phenylobacterium sp. LjRoot225 TaxID=3342285 RepID=UPI003ECEBC7D
MGLARSVDFDRFSSANADETYDYMSRRIAPHRMKLSERAPLAARVSSVAVGGVLIADLQYGAEVVITPVATPDHYLVHLGLGGATTAAKAGESHVFDAQTLHVTSPNEAVVFHVTRACRHLTVRLPRVQVEQYAANVLDLRLRKPLAFAPVSRPGSPLPSAWRDLLLHILAQVELTPDLAAAPRLYEQYARVLMEMLLGSQPHNYADCLVGDGPGISPRHVRRARDLIEAALDQPITIEGLAQEVGVSVRSLQNGFKQFLGMTPGEYVRARRLKRLHAALQASKSDATVTDLMLESGITNFGRFAQYYREQFGCRPSETLRRANGGHVA